MPMFDNVYLLFEQSGVFKNSFKEYGFNAFDVDIENQFNETDFIIDIFNEIDNAYHNSFSFFSSITENDLLFAFFPCTYFSCLSQMAFSINCINYKNLSENEALQKILERSKKREFYFEMLLKFISVIKRNNLKLILENPYSEQSYLKSNFPYKPTFIDFDRSKRGDFFKKPTAYWFFNIEKYDGLTININKPLPVLNIKGTHDEKVLSERSLISSTYAKCFIADFVLNKKIYNSQYNLFDNE